MVRPSSTCFWLPLWCNVDLQTEIVGLRTPNPAGYPKCSNLKDKDLENIMSFHQQLWSLECSVIETVASLLCGVTEHCRAWTRSQCRDKVDDIQTVKKSSTDQCNSSGPLLFSVDQWKDTSFSIPRNSDAYHHLFRMVQPFWWNVSVSVGVSWNGKTDLFHWSTENRTDTENDCMGLESRIEARFSTFSANRCDWISISCSETC